MKENAIKTSALTNRISLQNNQSLDLNKWIFDKLKVNDNPKILELCCGTGAQTNFLTKIIGKGSLDCVDINKETVEANRSMVANKDISYHVSSIDEIHNYELESIDLIFSAYGFYYSKDPVSLHKELHRKLSRGGKFVLVGPVLGNNIELYEIMKRIGVKVNKDVLYSSERFMLEMEEVFLNYYENVSFSRVLNKINYSSANDLLEYWKNTTFYDLSKEKEFLSEVDDFYNNGIVITKSISYLEGQA